MQELVITIPVPPKETNPNERPYTDRGAQAKVRAAKRQRYDAMLAALAEMNEPGRPHKPRWPKATLQATFYRPGRQSKLMDLDNCAAWLKNSIDGLADAGVILNDAGLVPLPPSQVIGDAAETRCVVLTIRPIT